VKSWIRDFWGYAGERALKTVAQTMLAMLSAAGAERTIGVHFGILTIDWTTVLSVSLLAGIMSILTSIVAKTSKDKA
jgi:hypothetical protein